MYSSALDFYHNPNFTTPLISGHGGEVDVVDLAVSNQGVMLGNGLPEQLKPVVAQRTEELYSSIEPVTVTLDGYDYRFEFGFLAATEASADGRRHGSMHTATYQGSETENIGNGAETDFRALAYPDTDILYAASIGMGISRAMSWADRRFLRAHGSLLETDEKGNARPRPVVSAFNRAVLEYRMKHGIEVIDHLSSDSTGAILLAAHGATNGEEIKTAHQNVRTNIWDKQVLQSAKAMLRVDPRISEVLGPASPDALRMTPELVAFVKAHRGQEYLSRGYRPWKSLRMLGTYAIATGRGPEHGDPLVSDNIALVRANGDIKLLFTVGHQDPLADNEDLFPRLRNIVGSISARGGQKVMAAIIEGCGHGPQTYYPQYLRALSRAALR